MSCQFKNECPSYSGWCEGPEDDFSRCIPFLINAVKGARQENASLREQLDDAKRQLRQRDAMNTEQAKCIDRLIAERDAAIKEIPRNCDNCKHWRPKTERHCAAPGNTPCDLRRREAWQWRGPKKEDNRND